MTDLLALGLLLITLAFAIGTGAFYVLAGVAALHRRRHREPLPGCPGCHLVAANAGEHLPPG